MARARKKYGFEPDYAVPPGETLQETMEWLGMTQKELAERADLTVMSLNRIFKGEQPITYETANRLELATGVPARMWNNLEANYREQLAKIDERERLQKDLDWLKNIPVKELISRGAVNDEKDKALLLREVLKFYGVSSVDAWRRLWEKPGVAARRSACFETRPGAASAWIRLGELQAREIECGPYNQARFKKALREIRGLTRETPDVFKPQMSRLCAEAGVVVVFVKQMQNVPWNSATKWLSADKAMILLSLRGKGEDRFWFSFFHEAGHVLHDSKKELLINDGESQDEKEKQADRFAAEFLIPAKHDEQIRNLRTRQQVLDYADKLGIAPGIVAGRYQYLNNDRARFKKLIRKFRWAEE